MDNESQEYNDIIQKRIDQLYEQIDLYDKQGNYQKMLECDLELHRIFSYILDEDDLDLISSISNLSISYSYAGDYENALKYGKEAYDKYNSILGPNNQRTIISLNNLANFYSSVGDYESALKYCKEGYERNKQVYGDDNRSTVISLNNLANKYTDIGDYEHALEYCKEAYSKFNLILGHDHPYTLMALNNLAGKYSAVGDHKNALEYGKKAYEDRLEILGIDHPDTLASLNNLAIFYSRYGELKNAIKIGIDSYTKHTQILGENHPDTIAALNSLSSRYSEAGDYKKALKYSKEAYEKYSKVLGANHPETLMSLNNLANRYSDLGDYDKALEYSKEVYERYNNLLGVNHPLTLSALNNLANDYFDLQDYSNALMYGKEAYQKRLEVEGINHPNAIHSLNNLATFYAKVEDHENALKYGLEAYERSKHILGIDHPDTIMAINNLSTFYSNIEDYNNALKYGKEAYEKYNELLGQEHPDTLNSLNNLALSYLDLNDYNNEFLCKDKYFSFSYDMIHQIYSKKTSYSRTIIKNYLSYFLPALNRHKNLIFQNIENRKFSYANLLNYKNTVFDVEFSKNHPIEFTKVEIKDIQNQLKNDECIIDYYELEEGYGAALITKDKYNLRIIKEDSIGISIPLGIKHIYICPDGKMYGYSYYDKQAKKYIIVNHHNFNKEYGEYDYSFLSGPKSVLNTYDKTNNKDIVSVICPKYSIEKTTFDINQDFVPLYGGYLEDYYIKKYCTNVTTFSGIEATKEAVYNIQNPSILHISTHGDIDIDPNQQIQSIGILAMSGYNDDRAKGSLTSLDIQSMNLKGTNLVVLSACDTAMGKSQSGEGVYGLRRALELAGVKTQLITTEPISDLNTIIFMKVFYYCYSNSNNAYQSLKDTKQYLLDYHNWIKELQEVKEELNKEKYTSIIPSDILHDWLLTLEAHISVSSSYQSIMLGYYEKVNMLGKLRTRYYPLKEEDFHAFIIQGKVR